MKSFFQASKDEGASEHAVRQLELDWHHRAVIILEEA
jgi:hypothetical protein